MEYSIGQVFWRYCVSSWIAFDSVEDAPLEDLVEPCVVQRFKEGYGPLFSPDAEVSDVHLTPALALRAAADRVAERATNMTATAEALLKRAELMESESTDDAREHLTRLVR